MADIEVWETITDEELADLQTTRAVIRELTSVRRVVADTYNFIDMMQRGRGSGYQG